MYSVLEDIYKETILENKQKPNKTLDWTLFEALTLAKTKFTNGQLLLFHYFKLQSETLNSLNA